MEILNEILDKVFLPALAVAIPLLVKHYVPKIVAWMDERAKRIEAASPFGLYVIQQAIVFGVTVAEQAQKAGLIDSGEKKQKAISAIQKFLDLRGVTIDVEMISDMIEHLFYNALLETDLGWIGDQFLAEYQTELEFQFGNNQA